MPKRSRGPSSRRQKPVRTKARLAVGQAIRQARRTVGLTQEQLGQRLGLDGQSVYRWESATATPTKRRERTLIAVFQAIHPPTAAWLLSALTSARASEGKAVGAVVVGPQVPASAAVELAVYGLAEDLELAPRRVRAALVPFLKRLRSANIATDEAAQVLESLLQTGPLQ
jgi:transcriptional regulator with XRE-family HTH domain